mmetsp:Transcript_51119/g.147495  ORF Transcript_51119/g.147495 Transcript_51119/m.147495 type:complete len:218 (+) Transcript_51119:696-1349(+)
MARSCWHGAPPMLLDHLQLHAGVRGDDVGQPLRKSVCGERLHRASAGDLRSALHAADLRERRGVGQPVRSRKARCPGLGPHRHRPRPRHPLLRANGRHLRRRCLSGRIRAWPVARIVRLPRPSRSMTTMAYGLKWCDPGWRQLWRQEVRRLGGRRKQVLLQLWRRQSVVRVTGWRRPRPVCRSARASATEILAALVTTAESPAMSKQRPPAVYALLG